VPVALASDCNPGTCPSEKPAAHRRHGLYANEDAARRGYHGPHPQRRRGRRAADRIGSIEPGKQADLIICNIPDYRHLFYHFGVNHVWRVIKRGRVVYAA